MASTLENQDRWAAGDEMNTDTQCQFSLPDCGTSSPIMLDRLHAVFDDVRYKIRLYESPWTEEDFNEMEATSQRGIGVNVRPIRRIPIANSSEIPNSSAIS